LRQDDPDLKGLEKEDVQIDSEDGVVLRGYIFRRRLTSSATTKARRKAIIVYFQGEFLFSVTPREKLTFPEGNVGSPIQRLPLFRTLLLHRSLRDIDLELLAVPPRSFGLSTNRRPSERALLRDYAAITAYASARARENGGKVVWMGHSLGASIATVLLASTPPSTQCNGLIFENGFASIPGMVRALYSSKWVPYHYLGPLALDTWDARAVFERAGAQETGTVGEVPILFVSSDNDELVPPEMMRDLYELAVRASGKTDEEDSGVTWLSVKDGLHDFAWKKDVWAKSVGRFVRDVVDRPR
jgi:pimeloyl-ACP methyl ester carboxylesterase